MSSTPRQWLKWLPLAELWHNFSCRTTLKCSPFKALYGLDPSFGSVLILSDTNNSAVQDSLLERQQFLEMLKQNLTRAQQKMKNAADANRSDRRFHVGELVLLKLQPYAQSTVVNMSTTCYEIFCPL
jgi:hypothetical protein